MAGKNISSVTRSLFIAFFFIALTINTERVGATWLIDQGPCSNFPDCDAHCKSIQFPQGGLCKAPSPGAPLRCYCISSSS
ncbi:hypothetical protein ACET3Z_013780 [Daucus carota]